MEQSLDPGCYTVLQLMLARNLFIGDDIRLSSLRTAWGESGQPVESFGNATAQLKDNGLIKIAHSTSGPVAQLTKHGFALGQKQRQAPRTERRKIVQPSATPPPFRRRRVEHLPVNRIAMSHEPQAETKTAHSHQVTVRTVVDNERDNVTHGGVFNRAHSITPNALQLCVLGLLRNHRTRANGHISYKSVLDDWMRMDLRHDDLLLAVKRLVEKREIETLSHPTERLLLTQRGFERYENAPSSMEDGMDRWQAKKLLRTTKRLGALPAA